MSGHPKNGSKSLKLSFRDKASCPRVSSWHGLKADLVKSGVVDQNKLSGVIEHPKAEVYGSQET